MDRVAVRKLDHSGRQVISYSARVVYRRPDAAILQARWDREPADLGFVILEPDDRWTEFFYNNRWYNIFEIRTRNGHLKGWYCNVTRPARISGDEVVAEDLELDVWVNSDGSIQILDEEEFTDLPLSPHERAAARDAVAELRARVSRGQPPFSR